MKLLPESWRSRLLARSAARPLQALAIGALLVLSIYPDVIFSGATVSNYGQYSAAGYGLNHTELYPERNGRSYHHGLNDAGGAIWQSEPMLHFMTWVLKTGESPYWNRFSGAGSVGPETMIDQKFSPFTVLTALAGGSTAAYHWVWALFNVLAISCLFYLLTRFFEASTLASLAGCVVYALNGYNIAQLNSNISQVYLFFPSLLLALCAYAVHPRVIRFVALAAMWVLVFANTFLPTTLLTSATVFALALGFSVGHFSLAGQSVMRRVMSVLSGQALAMLLAFLLLAFLYFPIIESFPFLKSLSMYRDRIFYPASPINLTALFTPKHFWESYNAIEPSLWNPSSTHFIGNVVFHFGIVGVAVASAIFTGSFGHRRYLVGLAAALLTITLGRIFGVPLLTNIVDGIYVVGNIGCQYWWTIAAVLLPILVAFGFDAIGQRVTSWAPTAGALTFVGVSLIYLALTYTVPEHAKDSAVVYVGLAAGLLVVASIVLYKFKYSEGRWKQFYGIALLILMFAELTFYMNHYRYERSDQFASPPLHIQFLKKNIGHYRVANYGHAGVPPEYGSAFQIAQISSMNMNTIPSYLLFYQRVFMPDPSQRWGDFATFHYARDIIPAERDVMFDMMGVKYVLISPAWLQQKTELLERGYNDVLHTPYISVFENEDVFPRVYAVSQLAKGEKTPDLLGFSPRTVALTSDIQLLESAQRAGISIDPPHQELTAIEESSVVLDEYRNAYIRASVNLTSPSVVVMMDNWHPNWRAFIDDKEVYIGLVNESFRGVVVPAGMHVLEMKYAPRSLTFSTIISLSMLLLIAILVFSRRRLDAWLAEHRFGVKSG